MTATIKLRCLDGALPICSLNARSLIKAVIAALSRNPPVQAFPFMLPRP